MMTDALLNLAVAQVVTATAVSTNTIDLSQVRDVGAGHELRMIIGVDQTATAAGAATVNFQVITSASPALTSPTILLQTDALAIAQLTVGRRPIVMEIPASIILNQPLGQRYLGLQYTIGTGPLTAGQFTAFITDSAVDVNKNYPSGFTVF